MKKTIMYLFMLSLLFTILVIQTIEVEKPNWKHSKTGKSEFSKIRDLSIEITVMSVPDRSEFDHNVHGYDELEKQWAREYYKLNNPLIGPPPQSPYDRVMGDHEDVEDQIKYLVANLTQKRDLTLLMAHRYGDIGYTGITYEHYDSESSKYRDYCCVFTYSKGGLGDNVYDHECDDNYIINAEIHENSCHDRSVTDNRDWHCPIDTCVRYAHASSNHGFCGSKTSGCLKKLIDFNHIDDK